MVERLSLRLLTMPRHASMRWPEMEDEDKTSGTIDGRVVKIEERLTVHSGLFHHTVYWLTLLCTNAL